MSCDCIWGSSIRLIVEVMYFLPLSSDQFFIFNWLREKKFCYYSFSSQLTDEAEFNVSKARSLLDNIVRENKGTNYMERITDAHV